MQEVVIYCIYSEERALWGALYGTFAACPPALGNKKFIYQFKSQYTRFFSFLFLKFFFILLQ